MGKHKKRNAHPDIAPPEKERFPGWIVWPAFFCWGFFVFRNYYGRYPLNLDALFYMLEPRQYAIGGFKVVLEHLGNIAAAVFFLFSCFSLGRSVMRFSGFRLLNALEETVFSTGLGLGLLSVFVFLLGIFKLLYFWPIAGSMGLLAAVGIYDWARHPLKMESAGGRSAFSDFAAFAIIMAAMALSLLGALAPEIFYDSLVYHLAVPNFYAIRHKIALMPYNNLSNLPLTHGMIYLAALLLKGASLAKLINYLVLPLTAASVLALGLRYFSWRAGLWAALIFCTVFHAMLSVWGVGTETLLALFSTLALYAVLLRGTDGDKRWLWLAAVFSGLSMGVKYTGLFTALGVMLVYGFNGRKNLSATVKDLALFTLIASLFVGPWLVKNYVYTGNPVNPMLSGIFKPGSDTDPEKVKVWLNESRQMGEFRLKEWAAAPWNITMGKVGNSEYFTPLFIFILPLCFLLAAPASSPLLGLWLFFLAMWLAWSFSSTMVRFFMPAYPAAGLIISCYLFSGTHKALKAILKFIVLLVCLISLYWSALVFYSQGRWKPVLGQVGMDEYLSHTQPSYPYSPYAGIKFINEKLPPDSKILIVGDGRSFYLKKDFMGGTAADKAPLVEYCRSSSGGDEVYSRMKADGLTHILLNVVESLRMTQYGMFNFDAGSLAVFAGFWKGHVKEVFAYDEVQDGKAVNRVGVYELVGKRDAAGAPPYDYISEVVMKGAK